jgi:hypothetical protein
MPIRAILAWLVVAAFAPVSHARGACWIERERPATADQLPVADARVAGMRASARAMNAVLKSNGGLQGLPDVRLRSTWQIHFSGAGAPYDAMMRQAVETLDWAAIAALMR